MFLLLDPWRELSPRHQRQDLHQDARHQLGVVGRRGARGRSRVNLLLLLHQQLVGVLHCEQVVAAT